MKWSNGSLTICFNQIVQSPVLLIILAYLLRVTTNINPIRCGDGSFSPIRFIDIFLILLCWLAGMHAHLWIYIHDFKTHMGFIIYEYQYLHAKRKVKNYFEQAINMTRKTAILIGPNGVPNCDLTTCTSSDMLGSVTWQKFSPLLIGGIWSRARNTESH